MQQMFPASNSGLNSLSSCPELQNCDDDVYLRSAIDTNTFTDPFQNDAAHNRENIAMHTLQSGSVLTGMQSSPGQSRKGGLPQSRDRILKLH
jgi:hypothetical protein